MNSIKSEYDLPITKCCLQHFCTCDGMLVLGKPYEHSDLEDEMPELEEDEVDAVGLVPILECVDVPLLERGVDLPNMEPPKSKCTTYWYCMCDGLTHTEEWKLRRGVLPVVVVEAEEDIDIDEEEFIKNVFRKPFVKQEDCSHKWCDCKDAYNKFASSNPASFKPEMESFREGMAPLLRSFTGHNDVNEDVFFETLLKAMEVVEFEYKYVFFYNVLMAYKCTERMPKKYLALVRADVINLSESGNLPENDLLAVTALLETDEQGYSPEMDIDGMKKAAFKSLAPSDGVPINIKIDPETQTYMDDFFQKFMSFGAKGLETPLMQGNVNHTFDTAGLFEGFKSMCGENTKYIVPCGCVVLGGLGIYMYTTMPEKYPWLKNVVGICSALVTMYGVGTSSYELFQDICSSIETAAWKAKADADLFVPEADEPYDMEASGTADFVFTESMLNKTTSKPMRPEVGDISLFQLVGVPIFTWLHYQVTGTRPQSSFIENFVQGSKLAKGVSDSVGFCESYLLKIMEYVVTFLGKAFNKPEWEEMVHPFPRLAAIQIPLRKMSEDFVANQVRPTKNTGRAILKLQDEYVKYLQTVKPGTAEFSCAKYLEPIFHELNKRHAPVFKKTDVRRRPINVTLIGPPGTGKSVGLQFVAQSILFRILEGEELCDHGEDPEGNIFFLNADANFHDGFMYQKALVIDELHMERDFKAGMSVSSIEMMRADNDAPYYPDQAALHNKANFAADYRLTLYSSNLEQWNQHKLGSMNCVEAIVRRANPYYWTVKKQYSKDEEEDITLRRMDPAKASKLEVAGRPGELSMELWEIHHWDLMAGKPVPDVPFMNYEQFLQDVQMKAAKLGSFSDKYTYTRKQNNEREAAEALRRNGVTSWDELRQKGRKVPRPEMFSWESYYKTSENMPVTAAVFKNGRPDEATLNAYPLTPMTRQQTATAFETTYEGDGLETDVAGSLAADFIARVRMHLERVYWDVTVDIAVIAEKVYKLFGKPIVSGIDYVMQTYVAEAYAPVKAAFVGIFDYIKRNPILSAFTVVCAAATCYSWFKAGEAITTASFGGMILKGDLTSPESGKTKIKPNKKPSKRERLRFRSMRGVHADAIEHAEMGDHSADVINKVCTNMFTIEIVVNEVVLKKGWALGLAGTTLVMPRHYLEYYWSEVTDTETATLRIRRVAAGSANINLGEIDVEERTEDLAGNIYADVPDDVVFLSLVDLIPRVPDIRRHLLSPEEILRMPQSCEEGKFVRVEKTVVGFNKSIVTCPFTKHVQSRYKEFKYGASQAVLYGTVTAPGDCGSPLFARFGENWKLISFHVAGNGEAGVGLMLSQEMVAPHTPKVVPPVIVPGALKPRVADMMAEIYEKPGGRILCHVEPIHSYGVTSIIKSELHDVGPDYGMKPAHLKAFKNPEGEIVDPRVKVAERYSPDVLKPMGAEMRETMQFLACEKVKIHGSCKEVWSMDRACFGFPGYDGITRGTSAGMPSRLLIPPGGPKGKGYFLGVDEQTTDAPGYADLCKRVEKRIDDIVADCAPIHVFVDCLKDEVLAAAKVDAGRTRNFSTADLEFQVIFRMFFGEALERIYMGQYKIRNKHAGRINPYSDWPMLATLLREWGEKQGMDLDAQFFDANLRPDMIKAALLDVLAAMYVSPSARDIKVREWLAEMIAFSYHLVGDKIVQWNGSNPSGAPPTIAVNDIVNQCLNLYVQTWFLVEKLGKEFNHEMLELANQNCHIVTGGDDMIGSFSNLFEGLTSKYYKEKLSPFGIMITNADKTDPLVNPVGFRNISDLQFLKRGFGVVLGRTVAPLEIKSIYKSFQWRDKGMKPEDFERVVQTALYEFALHGEEVFNEHAPKIIEASSERLKYLPFYRTFKKCFDEVDKLDAVHN